MSSQPAEQVTPTDGTRMAASILTAHADAWRPWHTYDGLRLCRDASPTGAMGHAVRAAVSSSSTAARKKRARRDPVTMSKPT